MPPSTGTNPLPSAGRRSGTHRMLLILLLCTYGIETVVYLFTSPRPDEARISVIVRYVLSSGMVFLALLLVVAADNHGRHKLFFLCVLSGLLSICHLSFLPSAWLSRTSQLRVPLLRTVLVIYLAVALLLPRTQVHDLERAPMVAGYGTFHQDPSTGVGSHGCEPQTYRSFLILLRDLLRDTSSSVICCGVFCFALELLFLPILRMTALHQSGRVVDEVMKGKYEVELFLICLFLEIAQVVVSNGGDILWLHVSQHSYRILATKGASKILSQSLEFHLDNSAGKIQGVLGGGNKINSLLQCIIFRILPPVTDLLIGCMYFWWRAGRDVCLIFLFGAVLYVAATYIISSWRTRWISEVVKTSREENAIQLELIRHFETITSFNAEAIHCERYNDVLKIYHRTQTKSAGTLVWLNLSQNIIYLATYFCVGLLLMSRIHRNLSTGSSFVLVKAFLDKLYGPIWALGNISRQVQQTFIDAAEMTKLYSQEPTGGNKPREDTFIVEKGELELENVSFSYGSGNKILNNLSFRVSPGTTIALVGASGCGKSTIIRLVLRFLEPISGRIKLDGRDITSIEPQSLRDQIAVVPQTLDLFNESVRYNIGFFKPHATLNGEDRSGEVLMTDIQEAAKAAQIHDTIMNLQFGYDTVVGEGGKLLSKGERQRIVIARAILKKPKILLLDEATSALDTSTETAVHAELARLFRDRTTIVVAHRLSTITSADLILVLASGRVVESGTHSELLNKSDGVYREMWSKFRG